MLSFKLLFDEIFNNIKKLVEFDHLRNFRAWSQKVKIFILLSFLINYHEVKFNGADTVWAWGTNVPPPKVNILVNFFLQDI